LERRKKNIAGRKSIKEPEWFETQELQDCGLRRVGGRLVLEGGCDERF